jgi:predicted Zn-dependent protease
MNKYLVSYIKNHQEITKKLSQEHWEKEERKKMVEAGILKIGIDVLPEDIDPKYDSKAYQYAIGQKINFSLKILEEEDKEIRNLVDERKYCHDCRFFIGQVKPGHCGVREIYDTERLIRCGSFDEKDADNQYLFERSTDEYRIQVRKLLRYYYQLSLIDKHEARAFILRAVKQIGESKGGIYHKTLLADLIYQWESGNRGDIDGLWFD